MSSLLLHRLRRAGHWAAAVLTTVLVWASLLGILHAVGHPAERLHAQTAQSLAERDPGQQGAAAHTTALERNALFSPSWLDLLFDHQANDRDCLIFDQLCHGPGAAPAVMLTLSFALPTAAALMTLQGATIARWVALFDARGPPRPA